MFNTIVCVSRRLYKIWSLGIIRKMELIGTQLRVFTRIAGIAFDIELLNTQARIRKDTKLSSQQQANIITKLVKAKLVNRVVNKENKNKTYYEVNQKGLIKLWEDYLKVRIPDLKKPKAEKLIIDYLNPLMLTMSFQTAWILQLEKGFVFHNIEEIFNDITLPSVQLSSKGNPSKYYKRINKYVADRKSLIADKLDMLSLIGDMSKEVLQGLPTSYNLPTKKESVRIVKSIDDGKEVTEDGVRVFVKKEKVKDDYIRIDGKILDDLGIKKDKAWVQIINPANRDKFLLTQVSGSYPEDILMKNIRLSPKIMKDLDIKINDILRIKKVTKIKNKDGTNTYRVHDGN